MFNNSFKPLKLRVKGREREREKKQASERERERERERVGAKLSCYLFDGVEILLQVCLG